MSNLYWLTDAQMERLKPFFPKSHGKPRVDDRRVLSGIIFINRDLPPMGPSIITRVCGFEICSRVCRSGQARRARSPQIAQALGALQRVFCCPAMSVA